MDFAIPPSGILLSKLDDCAFKLLTDGWSPSLVLTSIVPFSTNQFAMPAKDGLRLEDANNISQLICRSMGGAFQSGR